MAGFERDTDAISFYQALKKAVLEDRRHTVAGMMRYPVQVSLDNRRVSIRSKGAFLKAYEKVFTPCFRRVPADVHEGELWAKWSGVALPRGQLWFAPDERGRVGIITINGPFLGENGCDDLKTQH